MRYFFCAFLIATTFANAKDSNNERKCEGSAVSAQDLLGLVPPGYDKAVIVDVNNNITVDLSYR